MSRSYRKIIRNRKERIERRLARKQYEDQPKPVMTASNIHYEMAERSQGIGYGGIGAIHQMLGNLGLPKEINENVPLLQTHVPYWESDHVLNITYNVLLGGIRLEDIELRRNDEVFLNALGADRIPDPTTAGDFTRRFAEEDVVELMECINRRRQRVWKKRARKRLKHAVIDTDGTLAPTQGECKEGMEYSRKGIWGYHPLIVSLANTKEVLYMVNRPGNVVSHEGSAEWIDKAIDVVWPYARTITLRGDTDFYLTKHLDRWADIVDFVFGADANPALVRRAEGLEEARYKPLKRKSKHTVKTEPRRRPKNVKEQIVEQREFENLRLESEDVAEFRYRPVKCKREYRVVVVRKNISREKGEAVLFPEIRYFFYITTREDLTAAEVVQMANERCDQENVIEQLKNGVNALRMPVDNLLSNWAYMVMAALAWNLKAWFALMVRFKDRRTELLRMEFRRFLHAMVLLPTQVSRQGRKIIYRLMGYNAWLKDFFSAWEFIRRTKLA
ncbi:MAG: IS1380 family transposase [Verrucomicrobiota bacterium]